MKKQWVLVGDIHGDLERIRQLAKTYNPKETNLIFLGDLGANYFLNFKDVNIKNTMRFAGFTYYALRGNHEERPENIPTMKKKYDWDVCGYIWYEEEYPMIRYFLDEGGNYTIDGKEVLVLPGAYSIDKYYRLSQGWHWFEDEQMSVTEQVLLTNKIMPHYDYILSHTCPLSFQEEIKDLFLKGIDQDLVDDSMEVFFELIRKGTHYDYWYFGHYHDDRDLSKESKATMLFKKTVLLGQKLNEED